MSTEKTIPVTIRLDNNCLTALHKKAQGKQSFNSLVHGILDKYVDYSQYLEHFEPVVFTKATFQSLMNMLDPKQCAELAVEVVNKEASEFIHFRWGEMDLDSILSFMRMFFSYGGYGKFTEELDDGLVIFKVRHGMGKNCSHYIKTFIETLFTNASLTKPRIIPSNEGLVVKINVASKNS